MTPLQITAVLGSAYVPTLFKQLNLDSIIAYASSLDLVQAGRLDFLNRSDPKVIPVPLSICFISEKGLPCYVSTDLFPDGECNSGTEYWHKRFPSREVMQYCAKPNTPTTRGAFKEYRIPMTTQLPVSHRVTGYVIGNLKEVQRLLQDIDFIGKKPSQGMGSVLEWRVEEAITTEHTILQKRVIPVEMIGSGSGPLLGWTPPYWYRPWHSHVKLP
jgi:hypothetical protein